MLTPAQYTVARLRAAGLPRGEIARQLGVSMSTVDQHSRAACVKLGVEDRRALAAALLECKVGVRKRRNRFGWTIGDSFQITGGRYAGRVGQYVGKANSVQVRVRVGGGVFALRADFLSPLPAAPHVQD